MLLATVSLWAWTQMDLKDGGFEETPSAWRSHNPLGSIVKEAARTGRYGLRILDEDPVIGSEVLSNCFPVTPGKTYVTRFWTRSQVVNVNTGMYVIYVTQNGKRINTEANGNQLIYSMVGTTQWRENIFVTVAPEEARSVYLWIHSYTSSFGRIDIDDIEFAELTPEEAKKMTTTKNTPQNNNYPDLVPERIRELEAMLPEKPRGVGVPASNREVWDKLADTPAGQGLINSTVPLLDTQFPELPDDLYLEYTRIGNRTNYEGVFFKRNSMIVRLTLAECLEYKGRFLPKLEEFLDQFLSQKSWVLPAHDAKLTNFNNEVLYPDLTGSSLTAMVAYIDWFLQDKLKPETRQRIRHEAFRRSIIPYQNVYRSGKIGMGLGWMTGLYNWNAVCTSNMLAACLILLESRHDRAEALAAMEVSNRFFYRGFTSDGYCSEGLGYWSYGFGHYLMMGEIVLASTDGKRNIFEDDPVIPKCCEFARNILIEDGVAPAFADCGFSSRPDASALAIIQRHFPELLLKPVKEPVMPVSLPLFAIFSFTECKREGADAIPPMPPVSYFDKAGILICRSCDEKGSTLGAAIKGGHNGEAHNHNDVGSYVIVADKTPLVCDPGGEVYSRRTFSTERYTSKVLNSYGHDVPVVAGKLQSKGGQARGVISEPLFTKEKSSILIDLTSCYDVEELVSLTRRFTFDHVARKITVTDNVEFRTPQTFEDAIITSASFRVNSDAEVQFYNQQSVLTAAISVVGAKWRLDQEYIENPNRISPTRIGIRLEQPVLKATVECVYTCSPVDETFDTYYKETDLSGLSMNLNAAVMVEGEDFAFERGGKVGVRAKVAAKPANQGKSIMLWDGNNHELGWSFQVPEAGTYLLRIRYCHEFVRIVMRELRIDDGQERYFCNFPGTGGWSNSVDNWKEIFLSRKGQPLLFKLSKGQHIIYMKNIDGCGLNIDQLSLIPLK